MIPILFRGDETAFTSNGLGRLADCISCKVKEQRNGIYECEFKYPVNGHLYSEIKEGYIIGVTHDDAHDIQPFDIYARSAPIDGVVTFNAHHISYRLGSVILKPLTATSCAQALSQFKTQVYNDNPFTFWTDKSVDADYEIATPVSVKAMLAGQEGSILDVFGAGEYQWDKWQVKLYQHRGSDHGVAIRYGVNLTDVKHTVDVSGSYSAVAPFWESSDGTDTVVTLPEGYIISNTLRTMFYPVTDYDDEPVIDYSSNVLDGYYPIVTPVPLDLSMQFTAQPTVAELRAAARARLNASYAWLPDENIKVNFVALWQTEQYASVAALQRVQLCDQVSVYADHVGVNAVSMKVVSTTYNVLTDSYDEIELGTVGTSYSDVVSAQIEAQTRKVTINKNQLAQAVQHATDMITGGLGGYVVMTLNANGEPQEICIMDTPDTATAVNVWRFNSGGLGHSHSGYNGPYNDVALTADGQINANLITTGTLTANLLRAGVISDLAGLNSWNLVTGVLSLVGSLLTRYTSSGHTVGINIANGALAFQIDGTTVGSLYPERGANSVFDAGPSLMITGAAGMNIGLETSADDRALEDPWAGIYMNDDGTITIACTNIQLVDTTNGGIIPVNPPTGYTGTISLTDGDLVVQNGLITGFNPVV